MASSSTPRQNFKEKRAAGLPSPRRVRVRPPVMSLRPDPFLAMPSAAAYAEASTHCFQVRPVPGVRVPSCVGIRICAVHPMDGTTLSRRHKIRLGVTARIARFRSYSGRFAARLRRRAWIRRFANRRATEGPAGAPAALLQALTVRRGARRSARMKNLRMQ